MQLLYSFVKLFYSFRAVIQNCQTSKRDRFAKTCSLKSRNTPPWMFDRFLNTSLLEVYWLKVLLNICCRRSCMKSVLVEIIFAYGSFTHITGKATLFDNLNQFHRKCTWFSFVLFIVFLLKDGIIHLVRTQNFPKN